MSRLLLIGAGLVAAFGLWLALGGAAWIGEAAIEGQRAAQESLAGAIRRLRAGEPGALAGLMGLCFAYGFFHAAGPGHGKVLIGGYGVARQISLPRLAGLALAASLAQAATAIAFVFGALWVLGLTRVEVQDAADGWLNQLSYALIGAIGLWLMLRGAVRLAGWLGGAAKPEVCGSCGHAHGSTIEDAARVTTLREAVSVVAAVAVRPCTGALFLLVLTWQLGIAGAGVLGTVAMALGTASVGLSVAVAAVTLRAGAVARLTALAGSEAARTRILGGVEAAAGALIVAFTLPLILASF
jgi:ABC-type nickel/cobalt efflux system permease component RcnA